MLNQHHHYHLEILLGDVECRYGKEHSISQDIRWALPKVSQVLARTSNADLLGQKSDTIRESEKVSGHATL
jgi:hypothetical protein